MASNTPNLDLLKKDPIVDANDTFNIETMLNENWDKIDDSIGDNTIDDTLSPSTDTGLSVKVLLSWLANMVKSITGKASWRIKPTKNLEELNTALTTHQAESTAHGTATKTEAQAGTSHASYMTPLRTAEAIAALQAVASINGKKGAVALNANDVNAMPQSGGVFTGVVTAQNNTSYTTKQIRNITLSTTNPSGGSNGDIWIKYKV